MKTDLSYLSKDQKTEIHAIEWAPETEPKMVLQIAHGMVEFIDRYDRFARFLNEKGVLVVGNDHLGHGESITDPEHLGFFADPNGNQCVIEDMRTLFSLTRIKYPHIPYFFLGHSMGSFLTRQYIELYGDELDGAIIMGTGELSPVTVRMGSFLADWIAKAKGNHYRSPLLTRMSLGSNNKRFEPARTSSDWLTKDVEIVDAYVNNALNNFIFTTNAFHYMFQGIIYAQRHVDDVPKDLPILIISGADDPVGQFGLGPKRLYDIYRDHMIEDVKLVLYENDRHEILNETNYRQVYNDIYQWIVSKIAK